MIISFHHQFIFFAVPKTGSHTTRNALRPILDTLDWEQCILFGNKQFPNPALASVRHGHISYNQLITQLFPNILNTYFKFCFVRNPYERFVSTCYFRNENNDSMQKDSIGTMKKTLIRKDLDNIVLFKPQYHFLVDENQQLKMDFIGRFEQLQPDYDQICRRISIPSNNLAHINASSRLPTKEVYDAELKEMVFEYYKKDFEWFGYSEELPD